MCSRVGLQADLLFWSREAEGSAVKEVGMWTKVWTNTPCVLEVAVVGGTIPPMSSRRLEN